MGALRFISGVLLTLFSLKGIYNRLEFWCAVSIGLAIIGCSALLLQVLPDADSNTQGWIAVLTVTGAYVILAAGVKRGRDRSGKAIPPTFLLTAASLSALGILDARGPDSMATFIAFAIAAGFLIWLMIELGFLGHSAAPNPLQGGWRPTFVGVLRFFFGVGGTFNRLQFWGAMLFAIALFVVSLAGSVPSDSPGRTNVLFVVLPLVAIVIIYAAVLKRSRGRNGGGVLPLMAAPLAISLSIGVYERFGFYPSIVLGFVAIALLIQAVIQLGFLGALEPEAPEPVYEEDEEEDLTLTLN